jgi:citrate lyase subunit beta/citryl-CoA lyase
MTLVTTNPPPLTLLYAPADRLDRVAKAMATDADVVIVDLEDAVAPGHKDSARQSMAHALSRPGLAEARRPLPGAVQVRINHPSTPWHDGDVAAVADLPGGVGARIPKVESAEQIRVLARQLPGRALHLLIESALGVERAFEIATASPQVASLGLGEADLRSDLRIDDEDALSWVRSRIVVAARAAALPSPSMSAYTHIKDLEGLAASCRIGRSLGFCGRTAIHPGQLATIRAAFLPTPAQVQAARDVIDRIAGAAAEGVGAIALADGTFLDAAMVERARATVALAAGVGSVE